MSWRDLTPKQRDSIILRREVEGTASLARELNMPQDSLRRAMNHWKKKRQATEAKPSSAELFHILKNRPYSLIELSNLFDRSVETILTWINELKEEGYTIVEESNHVQVNTVLPKKEYAPAKTLADELGHNIKFAVLSDTHCGSIYSQPSAIYKFVKIVYEEGIKHIFVPGDLTCGLWGYAGQEYDMIPTIRPKIVPNHIVTDGEIELADTYLPKYEGLKYYILGGNHDYWHIIRSGIDAVAKFCSKRDDCVFLGYDVADLPLTENAMIRLWHPSGGVPYALSYRLQKGAEILAFTELAKAVETNSSPKIRILLAGHLHVETKFHHGPMVASLVGCFEGQSGYLKRKGLFPEIGGQIWDIMITDKGLLQRVKYEFIPFNEIENDWMNFPAPGIDDIVREADIVETLFKLETNGNE